MLALRKIAITGGIASGKSTVLQFFKNLGAYVVSTDEIVRHLLSIKSKEYAKIIDLFGKKILTKSGKISRHKIAKIVFNDPKLLKELEKILHPSVRTKVNDEYQKLLKSNKKGLFVVEIPLLFESELQDDYDIIITVVSDKKKSIQRFIEKTGYDEEEYKKRMSLQIVPEKKALRSDYVISNDETLEKLKKETKYIFQDLSK